jgi:integrase/recombinase XerD
MPEPWVEYLRGDKAGYELKSGRAAIHRYIHTYYDDVKDMYEREIFHLGLE